MVTTDVVIIGAGLSGLVCAEALSRRLGRHVRIVILDARERVGGRVASTEGGVDLGGSWVWPGDRHMFELAQRLGVATVPQRLDGQVLHKQALDAPAQRIGLIGESVAMCGSGTRRVVGGLATLAT